MKSFWIEAILHPLAATLFCLVFGLPFLILGVWGLLGWPFSIAKHLRD